MLEARGGRLAGAHSTQPPGVILSSRWEREGATERPRGRGTRRGQRLAVPPGKDQRQGLKQTPLSHVPSSRTRDSQRGRQPHARGRTRDQGRMRDQGRTRDRGGRGTSPCGASGGEPRHRGRAPWRGSREEVGDRRTRENEHRGVRPRGAQSRQVTETEAQGSPGWGGGSPTAGSGLSSEGGKRPEHGGWGRPPATVNEPVPLEPHTSTRSRREIFRAFYHN